MDYIDKHAETLLKKKIDKIYKKHPLLPIYPGFDKTSRKLGIYCDLLNLVQRLNPSNKSRTKLMYEDSSMMSAYLCAGCDKEIWTDCNSKDLEYIFCTHCGQKNIIEK